MKKSFFPGVSGVLVLFLIPYLMVILMNGLDTALLNRTFNVEMLLPVIVASEMGSEYELEAVKAQTIIARSEFYRKLQEKKNLSSVLTQIREETEFREGEILQALIENLNYEKAVTETESEVLAVDGKLQLTPYHELSAGRTRDGAEVLHSEEYAYLKSVESDMDKGSEDFLNSVYINQSVLPERLVIKSRDSAGYVTEILADGDILEGESFRKGMGLSSANFTIQKIGKEIRFLCKGRGHGLGFSQYGGNEMAKEKKSAEEILEFYFPEMELVDIYRDVLQYL
jgi:stage II sporulation protein D